MRLSDAIALGRTLLNPVAGTINDQNGGGCALGMAYKARGTDQYNALDHWPELTSLGTGLPCGCKGAVMGNCCFTYFSEGNEVLINAIVHLFNYHVMTAKDWTLDQLIDWVRSVEPAEKEPQEAQATETVRQEELVAVEK